MEGWGQLRSLGSQEPPGLAPPTWTVAQSSQLPPAMLMGFVREFFLNKWLG